MKAVILVACLLLASARAQASAPASGAVTAPGPAAPPETAGAIDLKTAARYFAEFDDLCAREGGRMWGVSFCGPILFVDPASRKVVANRADAEHALMARAGVYAGDLPAGQPIANTAIEWQKTRWTMIMWGALDEERRGRLALMGHESFHRMEPQIGLEAVGGQNDHLDTDDGRFWMQMEWNALQQALLAGGDARRAAIADALAFRAARRARVPEAAGREVPLEIFEGLAEYSGMRLAGYSHADVVKAVAARRAGETGFVRSFAYVSGPLYGFLLDDASSDWRRHLTPGTDLGDLLARTMHLAPAAAAVAHDPAGGAEARAAVYGGAALREAERARETKRQARLAAWRASLLDGPVLIVDLKRVTSGSFDPRAVFPMGENRTVYTTRTLEAEWGVLTVDGGEILEDRGAMQGRVSLAGAAADRSSGHGWTLRLADGWRLAPAGREGDLQVMKP